MKERVLVWDWPVRIGHWLMAVGFGLAWLTAEFDSLRLVHAFAGGTVVAVVLFRLLWGVIGSRHARFASFVRGPRAAAAYVLSLVRLRPQHHTGHNPAGAWAIVLLLGLGLAAGASGWATYHEIGGHWLEELHEGLASFMLGIVLLHVAGVAVGSMAHGENLVRAMLNGRKQGEAEAGIPSSRPFAAVALVIWTAVAAAWLAR